MSLRSPLEGCGAIEGPGGLLLRDLTLARREGVRGAGAREWLLSQGHTLPDAPNRIVGSGESGFVMSLSHREFWLLKPDSEASTGRPASEAVARCGGGMLVSADFRRLLLGCIEAKFC